MRYCRISSSDDMPPGVDTAVSQWLQTFSLQKCQETPNKIMVIFPTIDCGAGVDLVKSIADRHNLVGTDVKIVTPRSEYSGIRNFLNCGVTYVTGPLDSNWPESGVYAKSVLTAVFEPLSDHWFDLWESYYTNNWPALLSPGELMSSYCGGRSINFSDYFYGVMPGKLDAIEDSFMRVVGQWPLEKWLGLLRELKER